ncbi:MAG: recombinase family protein [Parasphingorhabdus sp.]
MNKPKQAVIYCRVSSKKQTSEGSGLDSQEHRCRQYADTKGYDVLRVFPDDVSGGGDFMNRPGMVNLLDFLAAGSNDNIVVIFDDLKRFARDTIFHFKLKQTLALYNAAPECLNFRFEDTPEGEFVETVFAAQGQLERLQNRRQTVQKMKARLEQGYWVFHAPVGYKFEQTAEHGKLLVRNEPLASIVQEALEGYASGRLQTQAEVKRFLEGFPIYPRDIYGEVRYQRVTDILTRPIYAGCIEKEDWGINVRKAKHEGLISYENYLKIQERLAGKAILTTRSDVKEDFPLRGFVMCGDCERPLTACWSKGGSGNRHAYYLCQYKHCESRGKSIRRDDMEEEFSEILATLQPTTQLFNVTSKMFKDLWEHQKKQGGELLKAMKSELTKVDKQIERLVDRIVNGDSSNLISAYENRLSKLESQKLELSEKCDQQGQPLRSFEEMFERALLFLSNPQKIWDKGSFSERRTVLKLTFLDNLTYTRNQGFRTPKTSIPFKVLEDVSTHESNMVPGHSQYQ